MSDTDWIIERLEKHHERGQFDCGQVMLNDWLKQRSGQFDRRDLARTYVAVRRGTIDVLGYYALANHLVNSTALPKGESKGLPRIDIPVILLGRLAVDRSFHGKGLGAELLVDALRRSLFIADQIGVRAVEVHAIDKSAKAFYLKFGFLELLDDPYHLLLPLHVIRKLHLPPLL